MSPPSSLADPPLGRVAVFSAGIRRIRHLERFLGAREVVFRPHRHDTGGLDAVAGWGHKPTADTARAFAREHGLAYLGLEDGFLRSVGLGGQEPPLSLVVDDTGIYYDARSPSRLERLLAEPHPELTNPETIGRARACRARIVEAGLSKYNHAPLDLPPELAALDAPAVLVVDQTAGDASVTLSSAGAAAFQRMLEAALDEHPTARIILKTHPDVIAGKKQGYLPGPFRDERVSLVGAPVNPLRLVGLVDHVYTVTSQLGFEALLLDKRVSCFGVPFYAGWGLTDDRADCARRGVERTLDELVAAALLLYPRYVDPFTGERCRAEDTIEHLALQRAMFAANDRNFHGFGFSRWKRAFIRSYLSCPGREVRFSRSVARARKQGLDERSTVLVWGLREPPGLREETERLGIPLWRMEDGFLRSVRLGSDLTAPGSLVLDTRGIYYDPSRPSDLEHLLQHADFTTDELERARRLRELVVRTRISKYNPTADEELVTGAAHGQRILLVPGQVEDDASVLRGSPVVRHNTELLERVRRENEDAYVVYKPHPDVVSGNRRGGSLDAARALCDQIVITAPIARCLDLADEVHTMTSLVGYEALLRGKRVVTYGQPFYAGWGLTVDHAELPRRSRQRTLDELVAATYLRYPRYYSFRVRAFCRAEDMATELERLRPRTTRSFWRPPWLLRQAYNLLALLRRPE